MFVPPSEFIFVTVVAIALAAALLMFSMTILLLGPLP
jgi:hypothetical protein